MARKQTKHNTAPADMLTPSAASNGTIYFGFGSNLWLHQMAQRCPNSTYLGIARLPGYRWIINDRGYANVVQVTTSGSKQGTSQEVVLQEAESSVSDYVWGLVYRLQKEDEERLDENEGVPYAYTKEMLPTQFWPSKLQPDAPFDGWDDQQVNITKPSEKVDMLVYVDRNRTTPDKPKHEYIYRMNMGIKDAIKAGVPQSYVEKVMRKFIPDTHPEDDAEIPALAQKQATNFQEEWLR